MGNIVHFESLLSNCSEKAAAKKIYAEFLGPFIPYKEVRELHLNLIHHPQYGDWIIRDTKLNFPTVKKFSVGLDKKTGRVTIPIFDTYGFATNIRYYQLPRFRTERTAAKIYNRKGCNGVAIFPLDKVSFYDPDKPLFWMKAEKDTMLASQMGLQAFCLINGEGTWVDDITTQFKDFNIYICGDNDEAGITAAVRRLERLQETGNKVYKIINLPTKEKDFADWVLNDGGTSIALLSLIEEKNKKKKKLLLKPNESKLPPSEFRDLAAVSRNPEWLNKRIRVRAIISGKSDRTYTIPNVFKITTTTGIRKYECPVGRDLLRFIRASDEDIVKSVRRYIKNPKAKVETIDGSFVSVSELEIIPALSPEFDSPYLTQKCYHVGESIEANIPYELEIMPTTESKSQETVGIITASKPINPTEFKLNYNKNELATLETFHPEGGIYDWLRYIADGVSTQYTKIFNRSDWHIVAMLSWACPLQFEFPNEGLQRGWLNTMAIGDTKTGKSEVVTKLREVICAGTFVNAENCTLVGLLGGAIKNAHGGFMLRWGKIPLNNRSLVIVEEMSGLSIHDISNLSEIRSSGRARLDKGGLSSETNAKTRLIFLSNVRGKGKSLSNYISGVRAIEDLVGHAEDISRFDLISTLTVREVSSDIINSPRSNDVDSLVDLSHLRQLIQFIWSLGPDNIEISREAYHTCLTKTKELGKIYHPSIPLFDVGSGRLKLARIAVAIACFCFNWTDRKILVESEHVEAAFILLQTLFDKPSCGYKEYSEQMFYRENISNETILNTEIRSTLTPPKRKIVFRYMMHAAKFTADELSAVAGVPIFTASKLIGKMVAGNILRKGEANVWEVTTVGKTWMERQHATF